MFRCIGVVFPYLQSKHRYPTVYDKNLQNIWAAHLGVYFPFHCVTLAAHASSLPSLIFHTTAAYLPTSDKFTSDCGFAKLLGLIDAGNGENNELKENAASYLAECRKSVTQGKNWRLSSLSYRAFEGDARFRAALR